MINTYQLRKKRLAGVFNNNQYFCTCSICQAQLEERHLPASICLIAGIVLGTLILTIASCEHQSVLTKGVYHEGIRQESATTSTQKQASRD